MLPNTQKITSEIALMPDMALKQMAMMHKNDPYVLPLIVSEDSRRKEMRRAAQARMAGAMPPKVNDAAVAQVGSMPNVDIMGNATGYAHGGSVLPENRGIGALPAHNLAHMADGGIAGYATVGNDGNAAPNPASGPAGQLAFNNEPVMRMAGGGVAHFKGGGLNEYADYIRETATKYGMDPDMAMRLFKKESGGDRFAESEKGAVGLGQLLPGTAKEMGLDPSERTDPHKNINASIGYFMKQMDKYKDPAKAAAAYNWGGGNLDKHLAKNKGEINPISLPRETADYLTKVVPGSVANAAEITPKNAPKDTSTAGMIPGQSVKAPAAITEEKGFFGRMGDKLGLSEETQRNLSNLNTAMAGATGATYIPSYLAKAPSGIATLGEKIYNKFVPAAGLSAKEIEAMRAANMAQEAGSAVRGAQEAGATLEEQNYLRNMMEANQKAGMPSKALEIQNAGTLREANEAARLKQIADQGRVATQGIAGLNATAPTTPPAPEDRTITRDDDMSPNGEIKQGIPDSAKESFMDAAKEALSPKKAKGMSDDDLTAFGLGLMASKNPNALGAAGEAGLGALAMKREQQKTEREDLYRQALAREANAKAATYESGSSNTTQALRQADMLYDNWLKSLNKIDAMQLTPEMQKQKQEEFLLKSFQMFKIAPPPGVGGGTALAGTQLDPLGLRKS